MNRPTRHIEQISKKIRSSDFMGPRFGSRLEYLHEEHGHVSSHRERDVVGPRSCRRHDGHGEGRRRLRLYGLEWGGVFLLRLYVRGDYG